MRVPCYIGDLNRDPNLENYLHERISTFAANKPEETLCECKATACLGSPNALSSYQGETGERRLPEEARAASALNLAPQTSPKRKSERAPKLVNPKPPCATQILPEILNRRSPKPEAAVSQALKQVWRCLKHAFRV